MKSSNKNSSSSCKETHSVLELFLAGCVIACLTAMLSATIYYNQKRDETMNKILTLLTERETYANQTHYWNDNLLQAQTLYNQNKEQLNDNYTKQ